MISLFATTAAGILLSRFARSWLTAMEKAAPDGVNRHMAYATTRNQKRVLDAIEAISGRSLLAFTSERRTGITPEISALRPLRNAARYWRDAWRFGREFSGPTHQRIYAALRALRVLCFRQEAQVLLADLHCRALFLFNDHIGECRAMAFAAKAIGARSIYVPHAAVTSLFPSLEPFTHAILDGEKSKEVYAPKRAECRLCIVGSIRNYQLHMLRLGATNDAADREAVGVAINYETLPERLEALLLTLKAKSGRPIIVRPHPALASYPKFASLLRRVQERLDITFDNGTLPEFLQKVRFLLSGASSIHLDSVTAGTPSYYADLDALEDYYGFGNEGVVAEFSFDDPDDYTLRDYLHKQISRAAVYDRFFKAESSHEMIDAVRGAINEIVDNPASTKLGPLS